MSRDASLSTINCTSCGAGLDVLGGGRVIAHICGYCGAELDAQDNYKVLAKFDGLKRPESPFSIGMSGKIKGVDYVIIGTLGHRETWSGQSWEWVDHQIFSPTHGYAWLTFEDGHLIFTRRCRRPVWLSETVVERSEHRPSVSLDGKTYRYYDTSTSKITFAEGEFTWAPRIGDTSTTVTALADDAMLNFSQRSDEREVYRSSYLTVAEVEAGFGIALQIKPAGIHPLQVFTAGQEFKFIRNASLVAALVCLVLAGVMESRGGITFLPTQNFNARNLPQTVGFDVTETGLTRIRLSGDAFNSWAYLGIELEDPEGEPLFEAGRTVEYYTGRDSEGVWSEGSNHGTLRFRAEVPGTYQLTVSVEESGLWNQGNASSPALGRVSVGVQGGLSSGFWLMVLGVGFGLAAAVQYGRRFMHRSRRWRGSDWTDED